MRLSTQWRQLFLPVLIVDCSCNLSTCRWVLGYEVTGMTVSILSNKLRRKHKPYLVDVTATKCKLYYFLLLFLVVYMYTCTGISQMPPSCDFTGVINHYKGNVMN